MRDRLRWGCVLLHSALVGFACGGSAQTSGDRTPVQLVIAVPQGTQGSSAGGLNSVVLGLTEEGLTTAERNGHFSAKLAESWQTSADGLSWGFRLRRPLFFHDGERVTAHEIKGILDRMRQQPAEQRDYPAIRDITAIEAVSDSDIVIRLQKPSALVLDTLSAPIYKTTPQGERVGTGPFRRVRTDQNHIEMEAHQAYLPRRPAIDRMVLEAPTTRSAWASMLRGQVDFVTEISDDVRDLLKSDAVDVLPYQRSFFYAVAFNSRTAALKSPVVRRALNRAVNRTAIIRTALNGHGEEAAGPLTPLHWAHDASVRPYDFDQRKAIQELEGEGFTLKAGNANEPPARLRFTCIVPPNYAVLEKIALLVQQQLLEIGIDMRVRVAPAQLYAAVSRGDFEAIVMDINGGPTLSRPYSLWHSAAPDAPSYNFFGYRSPDVDAALDQVRYARSDDEFRTAISRFERAAHDDPPAIFLAWNERARAISRRFEVPRGFEGDPLNALPLLRPRPSGARAN